jgi:hypothetical protein
MSAVGVGITVGAVTACVFGGVGLLTLLRRDERALLKRADQFARYQDLWLPPEFAPALGERLRRRGGLGTLLGALVAGPVFGWSATVLVDGWDAPVVTGHIDPLRGPMMFAVIAAPVSLLDLVVQRWDSTWTARADGRPPEAPNPARLADALPPWLTWLARCFAVLPPLVATTVCALHGRAMQTLLFAALALAGGCVEWGFERAQLRVLNGPRVPVEGPELAFDEAIRVTALSSSVMAAPLLVILADAFCCATLNGAGRWALSLFEALTLPAVVAPVVVGLLIARPRMRQYYRRKLPLARAPETAPC